MFRLASSSSLWPIWQKYPAVFEELVKSQVLKPLGHAFVLDQIEKLGAKKILEVGHGAVSPTFTVLQDSCECWGLDARDKDNTVNTSHLANLRKSYPSIKFVDGYLGSTSHELPNEYFDLVYSVSVIEHVPHTELPAFFKDMYRILRPGGIHIHSYDVYWRQDIRPMYNAILSSGFKWLMPDDISIYWDSQLNKGKLLGDGLGIIPFEHPYIILKYFSHNIPSEKRNLYNWTSIQIGCMKAQIA